jgi:hypothetical protein
VPGLTAKTLTGYFETEYASEWPGLVTNLPSSRIPPGACFSCNGMVVRGRLNSQPALYPVTGTKLTVTLPTFTAGENVCAMDDLQLPTTQQSFTVLITNKSVYIDYVIPTSGTAKIFTKVADFPAAYPRYARFGTCVIGNTMYISSASLLGLYALRPVFNVVGVEIQNPGGYFTSIPTVVFSDGGGSGAAATATLSGSNIGSIAITNGGTGYYTPPIVTFQGGSTTGPLAGQQLATATGILGQYPTGYILQEVSAFTGVAYVNVAIGGTGYTNPTVVFTGPGTSASATAIVVGGVIVGVVMDFSGQNYQATFLTQAQIVDPTGTGATITPFVFNGKPFIGGDFMTTMSNRLILGNIVGGDGNTTTWLQDVMLTAGGTGYTAPTVDFVGGGGSGAAATATQSGGVVNSLTLTASGIDYDSTPAINIIDTTGTGATAIAQLQLSVLANSTDTKYPDRIAWSAPNAYGFFDPNNLIAPGGFKIVSEARGIITSANVIESVGFIGHNGVITEMTPNTSNAETPFSFYPLWSADQGVLVRYGSMAQYGSTLAFLANDSAYTITPNGLTEIGMNIANQLQNCSTWNNGNYPLQGLYGSIVLIEGQKHYLITLSADDVTLAQGNNVRQTFMFDFNMS